MTARVRPLRCADQRGAGTVLGLGFLGLVSVIAFVAVGLGGIVVVHRRAESAADLAALAAASGYQGGSGPCDAARRIAAANGATVVRCALDGPVATVEVACTARIGAPIRMIGRARAGPEGLDSS